MEIFCEKAQAYRTYIELFSQNNAMQWVVRERTHENFTDSGDIDLGLLNVQLQQVKKKG